MFCAVKSKENSNIRSISWNNGPNHSVKITSKKRPSCNTVRLSSASQIPIYRSIFHQFPIDKFQSIDLFSTLSSCRRVSIFRGHPRKQGVCHRNPFRSPHPIVLGLGPWIPSRPLPQSECLGLGPQSKCCPLWKRRWPLTSGDAAISIEIGPQPFRINNVANGIFGDKFQYIESITSRRYSILRNSRNPNLWHHCKWSACLPMNGSSAQLTNSNV